MRGKMRASCALCELMVENPCCCAVKRGEQQQSDPGRRKIIRETSHDVTHEPLTASECLAEYAGIPTGSLPVRDHAIRVEDVLSA
jgi:hypothetical protein